MLAGAAWCGQISSIESGKALNGQALVHSRRAVRRANRDGLQYQTTGSVAPSLIGELHIGFVEIGTLIGLYHISGVFLSLPSGLIIQRVGDKRLCAAGLAAMALGGLITALSDHYATVFTGRLLSGMGAIMFNLVITKMTADWFARREIVLAMAVILSTWPFGIALGLFTQPRIAEAYGWRAVMLLAGGFCLLSMMVYFAAAMFLTPLPMFKWLVRRLQRTGMTIGAAS